MRLQLGIDAGRRCQGNAVLLHELAQGWQLRARSQFAATYAGSIIINDGFVASQGHRIVTR